MIRDDFRVSAEWPKPPASGRSDVARIRITANGELLTRLIDVEEKEERDYVRASAVSLAFWLADNWWRLRYESLPDNSIPSINWRMRHELTSASGGTLWPPLMIHSTGERVLLAPVMGPRLDVGSVRYVIPDIQSISGASFEAGIDAFFERVVETCANALDGEALNELVKELRDERDHPDQASWRRVEARLGYDPGEAPKTVMRALGQLEDRLGQNAVEEAAAATRGGNAAELLKDGLQAARNSLLTIDLAVANDIDIRQPGQAVPAPWRLGQESAEQVRDMLGIGLEPIPNRVFGALLGVSVENMKVPGTARNLPYSTALPIRGDTAKVALKAADPRDRRFELSCALADRIWTRGGFGIISKAKTDRQKFQRAFAQHLLVPWEDLRARIALDERLEPQLELAAKRYHVHPNVIRRALILERLWPEQTVEERLEAA